MASDGTDPLDRRGPEWRDVLAEIAFGLFDVIDVFSLVGRGLLCLIGCFFGA